MFPDLKKPRFLKRVCLLMEWSGRAPAPLGINLARGAKDKENAMAEILKTAVAVIGIDIGKNSFHVVGLYYSGITLTVH